MVQTVVTGDIRHLAATGNDIVVTGTLPNGDSTATVTHFIIDTTNDTIVGQIALPNAVEKKTAVSLTVKVPNASGSYAIGTFDKDGGFLTTSFLSVGNSTGGLPGGAVGRAG